MAGVNELVAIMNRFVNSKMFSERRLYSELPIFTKSLFAWFCCASCADWNLLLMKRYLSRIALQSTGKQK